MVAHLCHHPFPPILRCANANSSANFNTARSRRHGLDSCWRIFNGKRRLACSRRRATDTPRAVERFLDGRDGSDQPTICEVHRCNGIQNDGGATRRLG